MMAKPLPLNIFKTSFYPCFLTCFLLLVGLVPARAQTWQLVQSVAVDKPGAISIDRLSQVYVTDRKNNVYKFSPNGLLTQTFSPPTTGHIATAEAWSAVKTLLFYDDRQQITLLDRFLTPLSTTRLSDYTDGIIRAATLAADERIWLLNESDFTLSKIDIRYPDAVLKTQLNQILSRQQNDIRLMREYQNNLYLVDRVAGIYVFDNMGNYKTLLPLTNLTLIGFKGEELYFVQDNQVVFYHLYTFKSRSIPLPPGKTYQQVLIGEQACYLFHPDGFDIYTLK